MRHQPSCSTMRLRCSARWRQRQSGAALLDAVLGHPQPFEESVMSRNCAAVANWPAKKPAKGLTGEGQARQRINALFKARMFLWKFKAIKMWSKPLTCVRFVTRVWHHQAGGRELAISSIAPTQTLIAFLCTNCIGVALTRAAILARYTRPAAQVKRSQ